MIGLSPGAEWGALPVPVRAGLIVLVVGTVFDTVAHSVTLPNASGVRALAHLVLFFSMVVILSGVLADGVRLQLRRKTHS